MKIVFDIEKIDGATGKKYVPNVVYEMSEEKAKAILASTKYAHEAKNALNLEKTVQKSKKKKTAVETVENTVEKTNIDN